MTIKNAGTCVECDSPLSFSRRRNVYICKVCKKTNQRLTTRQREHPVGQLLGGYRAGLEWLKKAL
jgi:RNA polymerase-binding transcription factor DksA